MRGVDAFAQDWSSTAWGNGNGRPLLYINPPFDTVARVLRKVQDERPDCILILPVWPRAWRVALASLPVRGRMTLPHREDLLLPGPQVPNAASRGPKAPRYRLEAVYVIWGTP